MSIVTSQNVQMVSQSSYRHTLVQLIKRISTDIDVLCEQLVRNFVFLQDVIVRACSCKSRAKKETKEPGEQTTSQRVLGPP